jgi:phosphoribosylglycinamide formyltransferase-1
LPKKIKIGALISAGGTNLQAIIDACASGKINGDMVFVGSDNPSAKGLLRAQKHKIPSFVVDYSAIIQKYRATPASFSLPAVCDLDAIKAKQSLIFHSTDSEKLNSFFIPRICAENEILSKIKTLDYDLIVLAGFMRNLTPFFIDAVNQGASPPKIMNIHPALLPAFPGVDGYGDTYRYGCKIGGCTVHFVDYGEDSGPIIGQAGFPIADTDTLEMVKQKGLAKEWELYPACIDLYARNRLKVVQKTHDLGNGKTFHRAVVNVLSG